MELAKLLILSLVLIFNLRGICGHGKLMEPVNRSSMWRKGYNTPINYNDNQNYCGGLTAHHGLNGGKCGLCGDDYRDSRPRPNENTGTYGTGIIVETYNSGQKIHVAAEINANHMGSFRFHLCPLKHSKELEEEECFNKYPLKLADGSEKYKIPREGPGLFETDIVLPPGLKCEHCVLRWEYVAANNWGICDDGSEAVGCGPQETFRTCSDIKIQ